MNTDRKNGKKSVKIRGWIQALFFAFTNGYLAGYLNAKIYRGKLKKICIPGLNCYSCPGAFGACPIGALQSVLDSKKFHFSCYLFGFFLLVGSVLGRGVCGFLCPFGWIQDLLYKIPIYYFGKRNGKWCVIKVKKRKHLPGHKGLIYLKYAILVVFVIVLPLVLYSEYGAGVPWFCKLICPSGTLFGGIPLILLDQSLQNGIGRLFQWKIGVLAVLLILSVSVYRPFCKYLCPLGAIYSGFYKWNLFHLKVDESLCTHCGQCKEVCKMGVDPENGKYRTECIQCGECKSICKANAISFCAGRKDTFS